MMVATDKGPAASSTKAIKLKSIQSIGSSSATTSQPQPKKNSKGSNKRKKRSRTSSESSSSDEDSGSDADFVNVDFEFFGFIESDYQAIKHLLIQLFSHDAKDLDISSIADHFIKQDEEVGSTVKSEGEMGDPLAFIGVLPWDSDQPYIISLRKYLLGKTSSNVILNGFLRNPNNKIGIVLSERLVNMPVQIIPPLLRIFDEEMEAAGESFVYSHLLVISRVFLAAAGDFLEAETSTAPAKKKKKQKQTTSTISETFLYHLEDEILALAAEEGCWMDYTYSNAPKRGQMGMGEDFGVETKGRMTLIGRSRLKEIIKEADKVLSL